MPEHFPFFILLGKRWTNLSVKSAELFFGRPIRHPWSTREQEPAKPWHAMNNLRRKQAKGSLIFTDDISRIILSVFERLTTLSVSLNGEYLDPNGCILEGGLYR
jgi:hypothetical protein